MTQHCAKSRRSLFFAVGLLWSAASVRPALALDLKMVEHQVLTGEADRAQKALAPELAAHPDDGPAHLLLCRVLLSEELASEAALECASALRHGLDRDSEAQNWAGRAFGRAAERSGPISGLKLAGQTRSAFFTAHQFNPANTAAANDLGEFYVEAPSIVGGGVEKALALAAEIEPALPEAAHRLRALAAEKRKDSATAEREFLAATRVSSSPGAWVDLANFYVRRAALDHVPDHIPDQALAAARRAVAADRTFSANLVDAGSTLLDLHQPGEAQAAWRAYLAHAGQSDLAPAFRVHTLLGQLLAAHGDKTGARAEFNQALALAAAYLPAQKGLAAL